MNSIIIHDPSLRDGSHAVKHQLTLEQISQYIAAINASGVDVVEVGHGLGLGAASLQMGFSKHADSEILAVARAHLTDTKLGVHITPGYGTKEDLQAALKFCPDVVRVAAHCSLANVTESLVKLALDAGVMTYVALTMSHMISANELVEQAQQVASYGADGVILMDSAGAYLPADVDEKVQLLVRETDLAIGFHAHNNLGLAVANSLQAVTAGATIIDGTINGFGAGAGNTALEVIVAVLQKQGFCQQVNLQQLLNIAETVKDYLVKEQPHIAASNIMSGLHGVFCGFDGPVKRVAQRLQIDPLAIYAELGRRKVIAGQEDKILEVAYHVQNELTK